MYYTIKKNTTSISISKYNIILFKECKPVIAIFADHLLVPSRTLCLTAFIWPVWLFSSMLNTALDIFVCMYM